MYVASKDDICENKEGEKNETTLIQNIFCQIKGTIKQTARI